MRCAMGRIRSIRVLSIAANDPSLPEGVIQDGVLDVTPFARLLVRIDEDVDRHSNLAHRTPQARGLLDPADRGGRDDEEVEVAVGAGVPAGVRAE